ncbi:hypothetical protein EV714DRAFT_238529 [Schizophyllum commune]
MDPDLASTTATPQPAGGQSKSKNHTKPLNDYKQFEESPGHPTSKRRPGDIRQCLEELIGLKIGLVTNMITAPWALQAFHIVTRALKTEDPVAYECFRQAVGVKDENGEPQINFDYLGNVDFDYVPVHAAFDGPPFRAKDGGYGKGDFGFFPPDIEDHLNHIEANRHLDFKQLYPMKSGPHTYGLYGFTNEHQHPIPRYSDCVRTYKHSLNEFDDEEDAAMPDNEVDLNAGVTAGTEAPAAQTTLRAQVFQEYKRQQHKKVKTEILQIGHNTWVKVISHINPVFVIFDFSAKMRYRLKYHSEDIPEHDRQYFLKRIWPVVKPWFEPPEVEAKPGAVPTFSRAVASTGGVAHSAPEVTAALAVPARARLAKTAPVYNCDTSSPLTDFESSPSGPDTSTATGLDMTKRTLRPLKKPDFKNTAHAASDAGPNSPPPDNGEGPVEDAAFSTTQSALAEDQDSDSAKTDKKVVRFATVAKHDTGGSEEHSDDNEDRPAQTAASASSTTAESSTASATSEAELPSVNPPAPPPRRRTARTTAGRPPKPPAPLTRATSKQTVPKRSRSGNVAAAAESSTALATSSSSAQATSSSNDSGPSQRPSRAKKTGDKRSRDDDGESEDDDDDDEPDGSEFLPARRARKKVRAQGSNKPPARASSKGASKKGGKSGK